MSRLEGEIVRLGQAAGELRSDLPAGLLESLFEFSFIIAAQQYYQAPEAFDAGRTIGHCVDLFINGAGTRPLRTHGAVGIMASFRSQCIIFAVRNRHLFQGRLRPEVITEETDTNQLREQFLQGARKMGGIPDGLEVVSAPVGDMRAEWIQPAGATRDRVVLYTHGGGYVSGNCDDHRMHVAKLVQASGVPALLFDYRLAPEHPAPAAVEDTLVAYRWLLASGLEPSKIVIAGESAGGGLCLASIVAIRDQGLPLPAAAVASSPWLDLTCAADSYVRNAHEGHFPPRIVGSLVEVRRGRGRREAPVDLAGPCGPSRPAADL